MPDQEAIPNGEFVVEEDIVVKDSHGVVRVRIKHETGGIEIYNAEGELVFQWEVPGNNLRFGGHDRDGDLLIYSKSATSLTEDPPTFHLDSDRGLALLGGNEIAGKLLCVDAAGEQTIFLDGSEGQLAAGSNGADGVLQLLDAAGTRRIELNSKNKRLEIRNAEGDIIGMMGGSIRAGTHGKSGDLFLYRQDQTDLFDNSRAAIRLSAVGQRLEIRDADGNIIGMMGGKGSIRAGSNGESGDIFLFPKEATNIFDNSQASLHLNGQKGDIILRNADCAEEFTMADIREMEPGAVMVLEDDGKLVPCQMEYDTRVVGVVSGAGEYKPGIVLDRQPESVDRGPIALVGKAFCKVTADSGPIRVGDLLTTATVPGHAMKCTDRARALGALIGKALAPLAKGNGLIPIMVGLN